MGEIAWATALMIVGLAGLTFGGDFLVRGAVGLASAFRISPLVVGLTVVAFGTSAPELAVSLKAVYTGQADISVGNVVGSNIFNVLFILGVSALITPLVVSSQLVRWDVPLMIAASVVVWLMAVGGSVARWEGALLFAGLLAYTGFSVYESRRENKAVQKEFADEFGGPPPEGTAGMAKQFGWCAAGLVLLSLGSHFMVEGAVVVAEALGMSKRLIGLTIVAAGTSLPEVAASIMASVRGERDIAVGNVVGSNLFNILCVLGLSGLLSPAGVAVSSEILRFDFPVMTLVAVACLPIFYTGHCINRWKGGLFLGYYAAYMGFLILTNLESTFTPTFSSAVLWVALPLTVATLLVDVYRYARRPKSQEAQP